MKEYTRMDFYKEIWKYMSLLEKIALICCMIGIINAIVRGILE